MSVKDDIRALADKMSREFKAKSKERLEEMRGDDKSHFLIYQVLGVPKEEGKSIDEYQNVGRIFYNSAGRFVEDAVKLCFKAAYPQSGPSYVKNPHGSPKKFQIDCLVGTDALEIKWRDATTDGDHKNKENARVQAISGAGYTPIRIMLYPPNRKQAAKIQQNLASLYREAGGKCHVGDAAWAYIKERTGTDLKAILDELAAGTGGTNGG